MRQDRQKDGENYGGVEGKKNQLLAEVFHLLRSKNPSKAASIYTEVAPFYVKVFSNKNICISCFSLPNCKPTICRDSHQKPHLQKNKTKQQTIMSSTSCPAVVAPGSPYNLAHQKERGKASVSQQHAETHLEATASSHMAEQKRCGSRPTPTTLGSVSFLL